MRMDDENYFLINLDFNRLLVLVPAFPNTHKMNPSELFISIERKLFSSYFFIFEFHSPGHRNLLRSGFASAAGNTG